MLLEFGFIKSESSFGSISTVTCLPSSVVVPPRWMLLYFLELLADINDLLEVLLLFECSTYNMWSISCLNFVFSSSAWTVAGWTLPLISTSGWTECCNEVGSIVYSPTCYHSHQASTEAPGATGVPFLSRRTAEFKRRLNNRSVTSLKCYRSCWWRLGCQFCRSCCWVTGVTVGV